MAKRDTSYTLDAAVEALVNGSSKLLIERLEDNLAMAMTLSAKRSALRDYLGRVAAVTQGRTA